VGTGRASAWVFERGPAMRSKQRERALYIARLANERRMRRLQNWLLKPNRDQGVEGDSSAGERYPDKTPQGTAFRSSRR
jgi:hypothetical protein